MSRRDVPFTLYTSHREAPIWRRVVPATVGAVEFRFFVGCTHMCRDGTFVNRYHPRQATCQLLSVESSNVGHSVRTRPTSKIFDLVSVCTLLLYGQKTL